MSDTSKSTSTSAEDTIDSSTNDYNYAANFNPEDLETEETINVVVVLDISPSVADYVGELNAAYNGFINKMKNHDQVKDKMLLSLVLFNDKVKIEHGYQPITAVKEINITEDMLDGTTHLYEATKVGLETALDYRKDVESAGINCKTLLFVITDGDDNDRTNGSKYAGEVKAMTKLLKKEERNAFSFESILFGVGDAVQYEKAKDAMGINKCANVKNTPDDIRKMIAFISSSIISASTGKAMPDVDVNF